MKKYLILMAVIVVSLTASANEYNFNEQLAQIIQNYAGTKEAVLPNPKKVKAREERYSYPPGRMPLPVNVVVNKRKTTVNVMNIFGDTLDTYRVCAARNLGQKHFADDCRTPEGNFGIVGVYASSTWRYKGTGALCYGPYFVSVYTPGFYGIGMHGTNAPGSIPGRHSHGCMRLLNENVTRLKQWLNKDSRIIILPDDPSAEAIQIAQIHRTYIPGRKSAGAVSFESAAKFEREQQAIKEQQIKQAKADRQKAESQKEAAIKAEAAEAAAANEAEAAEAKASSGDASGNDASKSAKEAKAKTADKQK